MAVSGALQNAHPLYSTHIVDWKLMRDSYKGERQVKSKGVVYLPATSGHIIDGYGKSMPCSESTSVSSKDDLAACRADATWTKCSALKVSDYLACQKKLNADVCSVFAVVFSDPACAALKGCAFTSP